MKPLIFILLVIAKTAYAAPPAGAKPAKPVVKNRSHDFTSQVVEGEIYRPDYSVVTGDAPGEGWGVLRLRADFDDHAASDKAEKR